MAAQSTFRDMNSLGTVNCNTPRGRFFLPSSEVPGCVLPFGIPQRIVGAVDNTENAYSLDDSVQLNGLSFNDVTVNGTSIGTMFTDPAYQGAAVVQGAVSVSFDGVPYAVAPPQPPDPPPSPPSPPQTPPPAPPQSPPFAPPPCQLLSHESLLVTQGTHLSELEPSSTFSARVHLPGCGIWQEAFVFVTKSNARHKDRDTDTCNGYFDSLENWTASWISYEVAPDQAVEIEISKLDGTDMTSAEVLPANR